MSERVKSTIYSNNIEQKALNQYFSAMAEPFVRKMALMPDAHMGYSLPIGAVVATKGKVVPAWVGYDIGCGMCAVKIRGLDREKLLTKAKEIEALVYQEIPVGFKHRETPLTQCKRVEYIFHAETKKSWKSQLGTLGGGNHFIELGYGRDEAIWIVIHSGSRNIGHNIASHYMKVASNSLKAKEGHYALDVESDNGKNYIEDMNMCLTFALHNRKAMLDNMLYILTKVFKENFTIYGNINKNHNSVVLKDNLWIHRKGATSANKGELGIIPGNMRDGSFIVKGKGNSNSLCSSSHGAGRIMGRKVAKETLNMENFKEQMLGITATIEEKTLDESPGAYKNIFQVMKEQKDLVDVTDYIKPLINIKG